MARLYVNISIVLITMKSFCLSCNCFLDHENYKCRLGTITPYRFIANYDDTILNYPGCVEKKIWLIVRHGTRFPGKKSIATMTEGLPKLQEIILERYKLNKTTLTSEDASRLTDWKLTFNADDVMKLAEEGENELIDLAERYQSRFPSLMPQRYSNQTYKFRYTATQRTEESAKHFVVGLFGWHNSRNVWYPRPEYGDPVLRFYKRCSRWRKDVDENPLTYMEEEQFLNTKTFLDTVDDISKRVGHRFKHEDIHIMYAACAFEIAWNKTDSSPWCKLFSNDNFKVLEFAKDLRYFWVDGYGHRLSYEQACAALKDLFAFFASEESALTTAYFTHSGTILKLLALLGIAKDSQPLMHNLFSSYADIRRWRISVIDAFATNIAFVLYDCRDQGPSILLMHQERPVYLPGCPENMPCPVKVMKAMYPDSDEECQFDKMCSYE